ncbi:MAG: hypothetical protein JRI36_03430 [Deltaproteobacteria bacterium]|nr:hypothetical protein [Deltaproteobacteria bacterium]
MSSEPQATDPGQKALETVMNELSQMMATFKTYSGPHLDIDRGDFDVAFFRDLYARCATIRHNLALLAREAPQTRLGPESDPRRARKSPQASPRCAFLEPTYIEAVAVAVAK